jgi:hypothetical protein
MHLAIPQVPVTMNTYVPAHPYPFSYFYGFFAREVERG